MSRAKVSIDETYTAVALIDDGEIVGVLLGIGDETKLNEGICNGILKTCGTIDEGMGISIETSVMDSGRPVAF